jgi:hypothetical protein
MKLPKRLHARLMQVAAQSAALTLRITPRETEQKEKVVRMLKRFIITIVGLLLCATGGFTQSRRGQGTAARVADAAIIDIIQVDFKNYTFLLNGKSYKLIDGFYAETIAPDNQWGLMFADGPYYGDLTGDRKDEVAFVLRYGPVGNPDMAEMRVYTLRNGKPLLLSTLVVANSISCELDHYIDVDDGMIRVERTFGSGQECDHNEITQYRWDGRAFMPVGEIKRMPCRCM